MPQVPEPLVRRHKALDAAATVGVGKGGPAVQHHLKCGDKLLGNLEVRGVAGVVERDENLVR